VEGEEGWKVRGVGSQCVTYRSLLKANGCSPHECDTTEVDEATICQDVCLLRNLGRWKGGRERRRIEGVGRSWKTEHEGRGGRESGMELEGGM